MIVHSSVAISKVKLITNGIAKVELGSEVFDILLQTCGMDILSAAIVLKQN